MAADCLDINKSPNGGCNQESRVLKALLPSYAPVDSRDDAELILFAKRYAAYLNYYNDNNEVDGDWQSFMSLDISVTLAAITKTDVSSYQGFLKIIFNNIKTTNDPVERVKYLKVVFDFIFSVAIEQDQYYKQLPAGFEFKEFFESSILAKMREPLNRLAFYYNDFVSKSYVDPASDFVPGDAPLTLLLAQDFSISQLDNIWTTAVTPIDLHVPDPGDISGSIYHLITHNIFNAQIDSFLKAIAALVVQAGLSFKKTVDNFPSHSPHYALFLAFLKLYAKAQDQLNTFTGRHLDFYYKDVLQLKFKEALPDSVHLLIELQKGIEQHLLKNGTLFKAGKDADGNEINYASDEEVVINRASVKSLQSIMIERHTTDAKPYETVYASPIANTADGQGASLNSINKEWFAFGDVRKMQEASLGFAIASHYLYLKEGLRKIALKFSFANSFSISGNDLANAFTIQLTGKKGWHTVDDYDVVVDKSSRSITFSFSIDADAPAIIGYAKKIHQADYTTDLPIARFYLNIQRNKFNPYLLLKELVLKNINISVQVEGIKDVVIQNDEGSLDPSKAFTPFGSQPKVGSSFIIGSKEIFQKKLSDLSVVIDWDEVPDSLVDQLDEALHEYEKTLSYIDMKRKFHTVKISVLDKGKWSVVDTQKGMFTENVLYDVIYNWSRPEYKYASKLTTADVEHAVIDISTVNIHPTDKTYENNDAFTNTSIAGFIKLELNYPDFGHSTYPQALRNAAQSVTVAVTGAGTANMTMSVTPTSALPKEPYTPKVKTFSLNYSAQTDIDLQTNNSTVDALFFHLTPFGYKAINSITGNDATVVPVYNDDGNLFIGFEHLLPSSTLNVLFQLAEGTSNPLKQSVEVKWFYLSSNVWLPFDKTGVIDATNDFTQSGIVTFNLPAGINTGNTILDRSLSWIKAVVSNDTDAVCKIISIAAQAVKATLQADVKKGIYFKKLLPANTISKLFLGDSSIKKISQPYESFAGRVAEKSTLFYTRVSERLRHKQRAISMWDYERIVLEQFPAIYKAKCIAHSGLIPTNSLGIKKFSETKPGYVTIVTIPDLRNHSFKNPLQPYTSIGVLKNIKEYLARYVSPFLQLYVLNPRFEEVQFQFNVKIMEPFDESFYVKQLSLDIEKFLCPWAFEQGQDIAFGGRISKSVVLNFIEERPYVDYVTCFRMNHFVDRGTGNEKALYDVEEAKASTGISILVSYFDEKTNSRHLINEDQSCVC